MNVLIAADMEGIAGIDDGQSLNEVQVYAQGLAAEGIPVLVASGDRCMLDELGEDELGSARRVSREYRQLAKLLPAGHDSRARAVQRRLGSLLATPVMRSKERRWLARAV